MVRDEELCHQLQEGSEAAMEALVHRHQHGVFSLLYRLSGDVYAADDLTQETFLRLCTRIGSYRYPEPFLPWLYTIAHNLYRDWRKNAYQRRVVTQESPEAPGPVDLLDRVAQRSDVVQALHRLSEHHRTALVLRFYHDLTVEQIARMEGVPAGTVKSRLSTAIRQLRDLLTKERRAQDATD